jgi:hypothetical protein
MCNRRVQMGEDFQQDFDDLERRYDGPVPAALRRIALAGGAAAATRQDAIGRSAVFDRLARRAVAMAARERRHALSRTVKDEAGTGATDGLVRYRTAGLYWRGLSEP